MKKIFTLSIFIMLSFCIYAQAPQSFQYQAVVRDASGTAMVSQPVNFQISIISGSITGTVEYVETHTASTNAFGIVTLNIGTGTASLGTFSGIIWGITSHYIKVEADPTGGTSYLDMGTTQLLSVPYSLYSEKAGNIPTYSGGTGIDVTGTTISNTSPDQNVTITQGGATTVSGTYPNFTISSTDNNTIYNAGTGINITGTTISNTAPDQTVTLAQGGSTTVTGTYPNFTISSTDLNSGTPGGLNKTVQFNNAGLFGGNSNFIWDNSNERLGVGLSNPSGRMVIQGSATALATEPLFEVKNKLGQTIFVVYEDSVNVFVNDDAIQSNRGGFAVSGRNNAKAITHNYLKVTPDKTRIFLNEDAASDGFAVMGINSGGNSDYLNVSVDTNEVIDPSDPRILWYPTKEAFLTGRVLVESRDSVGTNSFASGFESKSIGNWSQALGYKPIARGNYSTSIGNYANSNGINSYAFGNYAFTQDSGCYALGSGAQAIGKYSFALGSTGVDSAGTSTSQTKAKGNYSYAFGMGAVTSNNGAFAFGTQDTASGIYSLAMGYKTKASGGYSTSLGYKTIASGSYSTAMGNYTIASGNSSVAMGEATRASNGSFAMGGYSVASGGYSTAIGNSAYASGSVSTAIGSYTSASGTNATAFGSNTVASGDISTAIGNSTDATGQYSTAMGSNTTASGHYSTTMGSGTTASGLFSTALGLNSGADGDVSTAIGVNAYARSYGSMVIGRYNNISGNQNSWVPTDPLFVIGNGASMLGTSNALIVLKNGSTGIGSSFSDPNSTLQVFGSVSLPIITINANTTLNNTNYTVLANAVGISVTLPNATLCSGRVFVIKKITATAGNVTITPFTAQLIEGVASYVISALNTTVVLQSNGTNWYKIN